MKSIHKAGRALIALALLLGIDQAHAYDFVPTQAQFSAWPAYCQARYATTTIGASNGFSTQVSTGEVEYWRDRVGDHTFNAIHHYCAGIIYLAQSKIESNAQKRKFLLESAKNEVAYTYRDTDEFSSLYPDIIMTFARVQEEFGDPDEAARLLQQAIDKQPKRAELYSALALQQRRRGELESARDTLLKGDAAVAGVSAEIHYNLGLIFVELKDLDSAVKYAQLAYGKDYPLPGLRNKLKKMGRPVE